MDQETTSEIVSRFTKLFEGEFDKIDSFYEIYELVTTVMQMLSSNDNFKGKTKKKIVVNVITTLLENSKLNKKHNKELQFFIDNILPTTIDYLVSASINKWTFKKIQKKTKKLFCC